MARDHGHQGYTIAHVTFDGALHKFLSRRMRQWHLQQAIGRAAEQRSKGLDPQQLQLMEWVVDTQCVAHACHNSLKWGMHTVHSSMKDHMEALWKVFASLQNTSGDLLKWLPQWLAEHVAFVPQWQLPSEDVSHQ
eukprot:11073686-Lingulodinium_polyedra.AAC.1